MEIVKPYKFRLLPNIAQEAQLIEMAGCRRFVWNWGLERRKSVYRETGKNLNFFALCKELTELKKKEEFNFLNDGVTSSLQQSLQDLDKAFKAFFEKRAKFPKFKSRKKKPLYDAIHGKRVNSGAVRKIAKNRESQGSYSSFYGGRTQISNGETGSRWLLVCSD